MEYATFRKWLAEHGCRFGRNDNEFHQRSCPAVEKRGCQRVGTRGSPVADF